MNFHLHYHRKLSEVLHVPEGLRELMADITREVLRYQPQNIEAFIADYLESMLLTREVYQITSKTVDDIVDSSFHIADLLKREGISEEKCQAAVKVIREEFKRHFATMDECEPLKELNIIKRLVQECKLTIEQAQKASESIESAWNHFYRQNKNKIMKISPEFAHHDAVKNTLSIYEKSKKVNDVDLKKAASALDVGFQGYLKRKMQAKIERGEWEAENSLANWQTPNFQGREHSAFVIQKWFRGQLARIVRNKVKDRAARIIQACYTQYKVIRDLKREQYEKMMKLQNEAARKIQNYYHAHQLRKILKIKQKAATIIQAHFRGFMTRKIRHEMNF